jgi:hypothetical protein
MKINENFRHAVHIDQWAILEYFKTQEIDLERLKYLKGEHYMILGYIIDNFLNTGLKNKEFEGLNYTWMGNSLFFNNLPIIFIRTSKTKEGKKKEYLSLKRNLQNYLNRLIEFGFIYREIDNKTTRYLRVNERFLTLCDKGKYKISTLKRVNKYFKKGDCSHRINSVKYMYTWLTCNRYHCRSGWLHFWRREADACYREGVDVKT